VVPLNEALGRSIGAELSSIAGQLRADWRPESPEAGLVEWAAHLSGTVLRFEVEPLTSVDIPDQRWGEAPVLAAAGYRMGTRALAPEAHDRWLDGMTRLMPRDAVPPDRNSFFFRPVELLGVAVGASAARARDPSPSGWLSDLIANHGEKLHPGSVWSTVLTTLAAREIGSAWTTPVRLDPRTTVDAAVLAWLHLVDPDSAEVVSAAGREALGRHLLLDASREGVRAQGIAEGGIVWIALERAVLAAIDGLELRTTGAADFVVTLCRRFPLLVGELAHRHSGREPVTFTDEYDVQDVLRALLRVHFDDVRPEEWNPSYGGVASRSDLLIKSERVVVETKMTRKGLGQREVVEELTVDKAQYRTHPDCDTLVCFVYDPEKRLSNPSALEADLSGVDADLTTKVVVSPRGL
jgi:hypothetical protein